MRNDIIELFTEIDDDLISSAMPEAQRPVELRVDTKRFSWKKFAAAAACLTAAAVGGTFALKALSGNGGIEFGAAGSVDSESTGSVVLEPANSGYPEEAKYQYTGDFSELELYDYAVVDRIPCLSFDELVDNSDLIVLGTFVDDARQDRPTDGELKKYEAKVGSSYNKLRIDKVFYGDIEAGEEIVICDISYVTDGKLMCIASDTLTPMIKGEQWVYFLRKQSPEFGDCYQPLFTEGRYPVPGNENTFVLTDSQHGVFDEKYFHEDIYADVKKMLGYVDGVEIIDEHPEDDKKVFTMPEFPGEEFIWTEENISVCRKDTQYTSALYTAPGITSLYLTDLNGDGKRELVTLGLNSASGLTDNLVICDHANSVFYTLKNDTATNITNALEIRDNELYVVTKTLDDGKEVSAEPLTFDMLKPITQPGYILAIY